MPLDYLTTAETPCLPDEDPDIARFVGPTQTIHITRFEDRWALSKTDLTVPWDRMDELLLDPTAKSKDQLPLLKLGSFGEKRTKQNCLRFNDNMLAVTGVEGDYDAGKVSPEWARDRLEAAGIDAIVYTSPSHREDYPKFRVLCPFTCALHTHERTRMAARLNGVLEGVLAPESFTDSQSYYYGRLKGAEKFRIYRTNGSRIDDRPDLDATAVGKRGKNATKADGNENRNKAPFDVDAAIEEVRNGETFHNALMSLAGYYASTGASAIEVTEKLVALMKECNERGDKRRFNDRLAAIPKQVAYVMEKRAEERQVLHDKLRAHIMEFDDLEEEEDIEVAEAIEGVQLDQNGVLIAYEAAHKGRLRFNHDSGTWMVRDGHVWRPEKTKLALRFARGLATKVAEIDPAKAKALKSVAYWEAIERGARTIASFATLSADWDTNPYLLGTPTGIVDLRTGETSQAGTPDLISRSTSVGAIPVDDFQAEVHCPEWLRFLDHALREDVEAISFLQRFWGYCLTGSTDEQSMLFIHGPAKSGKTTCINVQAEMMGSYAINIATSTLTQSRYEAHPEELARLNGPRLALASETEKGQAWRENRIKQLTGGDIITARYMRENSFDFTPQFKLAVVGNNSPALKDVDGAFRRRFIVLPFDNPPEVKDLELPHRLRRELPGILTWTILGCLEWQKNGLLLPAVSKRATDRYFDDQDVFQQWIDDCCELEEADTTANLWESWSAYARGNGEDPGSRTRSFPETLSQRGFEAIKDRKGIRGRGYAGIRVTPEACEFDDDEFDLV